jgi:hypothetical protein
MNIEDDPSGPEYAPGPDSSLPGDEPSGENFSSEAANSSTGDDARLRQLLIARDSVDDPRQFDPSNLKGLTQEEVKDLIPSDWIETPSKSGGGEVFSDPDNPGRQIRIMPGYGEGVRPDPMKAGPYAAVSQNGVVTYVSLYGNPTLR